MPGPPRRNAFLLSQLGAFASAGFAELTEEVGLTPGEAGVLRLLGRNSGISQRALAERLDRAPSRVVALLDGLQSRGLVARTRSATDRRNHELTLTADGRTVAQRLRLIAERNEQAVLAPLDAQERDRLAQLLGKLATAHGLDADLHRSTAG